MAWGQTPDLYTTPLVKFDVAGSPWLADAAITSWTVERELVGSTLPGNIRTRTGLSVGDGTVNVVVPGEFRTPWDRDPARKITTGATARLYVEDGADTFDLGQWRTDSMSGSLLSGEIPVTLVEAQYAGKKMVQAMPPPSQFSPTNTAPDPISVVDAMARQMGYRHVTWPIPDVIFTKLPLTGSFEPLAGPLVPIGCSCDSWGTPTGLVGPEGATTVMLGSNTIENYLAFSGWISIWITVKGTIRIVQAARNYDIAVDTDARTFAVRNNTATGSVVTGSWSSGDAHTIRIEIGRTYPVGADGNLLPATQLQVSVNGDTAAVDNTLSAAAPGLDLTTIIAGGASYGGLTTAAGSAFTAVQIGSALGFTDPNPANADLVPLGGSLSMPYIDPAADPWTAIQTVCEKWLGAAYVDRESTDGIARLVVLDRAALAGAGTPGDVVEVGAEWSDIPWTLDPADVADRLEVTYTPPALTTASESSSDWWPQLWQSDDVISVPAHGTRVIHAQLATTGREYATQWLGAWLGGPDTNLSGYNTFSVFDNATGTGTHLKAGAVTITTEILAASRVDITIVNNTGAPVYLVDANGDACLILRAFVVASFDSQSTIALGAETVNAENPLTVDLGPMVQSDADAAEIASYLWARCSTPLWKASSVQCRLDWRHDIGRVLALKHPATGLDVKALIVKVAYAGSAGALTQQLDLVLLPFVWTDADALWAGETWTTWDTDHAAMTWDDFDANPLGA